MDHFAAAVGLVGTTVLPKGIGRPKIEISPIYLVKRREIYLLVWCLEDVAIHLHEHGVFGQSINCSLPDTRPRVVTMARENVLPRLPWLQLGGILSFCESPEELRGLEKCHQSLN